MASIKNICPPTAYQGGKQRIAKQIVDIICLKDRSFCDLCCGSGSLSIEMIRSGVSPSKITMVDAGPWGLFWSMIGNGIFDLEKFKSICADIPSSLDLVQKHMTYLSKQPADINTVYVFLLLQASSFGSKAIWINNNKWMNCSFRNYWLPTETSSRRSPVNPMMPMPGTLIKRVELICKEMLGVCGRHDAIENIEFEKDAIIYIDPPYVGTTAYGHSLDVLSFVSKLSNKFFVSEGKALSDNSIKIEGARKKGGISGDRKNNNEEWISEFN